MILIYLVVLMLLGVIKYLFWRRTVALETKYVGLSKQAKCLAEQLHYKAGNSSMPRDAFKHAKRQFELGRMVEKRDQIEKKYVSWQAKFDAVARKLSAVTRSRGRVVPYLMGAVDVAATATMLHVLGLWSRLSPVIEQWIRSL